MSISSKIPIKSSGRKPTVILGNARRETLVLLMPTKARDQGYKELDTNLIKIISLKRDEFHESLQLHKLIPMLQAMKIPDAKEAVVKEWDNKIPAWQLTKVRNKKEVIDEARNHRRKVHFSSLMDLCHLKNSELELQYYKCKGRVVSGTSHSSRICSSRSRLTHDSLLLPLQPRGNSLPPSRSSN